MEKLKIPSGNGKTTGDTVAVNFAWYHGNIAYIWSFCFQFQLRFQNHTWIKGERTNKNGKRPSITNGQILSIDGLFLQYSKDKDDIDDEKYK